MTPTAALKKIREMLRTAAADYGEKPTGTEWRMENDELRAIYRLTRAAKGRKQKSRRSS